MTAKLTDAFAHGPHIAWIAKGESACASGNTGTNLPVAQGFKPEGKRLCLANFDHKFSVAQKLHLRRIRHFSSEMATAVMAVTPVASVGSGSGWKRLVCGPGSSWPAAWAAASWAGLAAPRPK